MEAFCHYCGKPCDPENTISLEDNSTAYAHYKCLNDAWEATYAEIEADYQAGRTDWHVVNGKIERRGGAMSGLCHNCGMQIDEDKLKLCGRCQNLEPAPVTDKDREEEACKFAARICENIDFANMGNTFHFVKDQYIFIRKAAYEEGLRDGSKRE